MPVSGAIWLSSTDLADLSAVLWGLREQIVNKLDLPSTFAIVEYPDFNAGKKALERRVRELKDAKAGEEGVSVFPLAANCTIHPERAANHWYPSRKGDQLERRALVCETAERRFDRGYRSLGEFLGKTGFDAAVWDEPWKLGDFATGRGDQYIAVLKADGDGMSAIVESLDWEEFAAGLAWDPEEWKKVREWACWPDEKSPPALVTAEDALTRFQLRRGILHGQGAFAGRRRGFAPSALGDLPGSADRAGGRGYGPGLPAAPGSAARHRFRPGIRGTRESRSGAEKGHGVPRGARRRFR